MSARTIVIVVVALVVAVASAFVLDTGTPHVEVKAETLFEIAPGIPFANSLTIMILTDIVVIGVAFAATRNMQLVPRGLQNVMEYLIESLHNIFGAVNREWIDRGPTFPIIATIFIFLLVANWLGLVPGVGPIGVCKSHEGEHQEEEHMEEDSHASGFTMQLASAGPIGTGQPDTMAAAEEESGAVILGCEPGESLVPIFRTPSADLNFTFGLALLSFVYIEIVGFQALGAGYLGKFFNFHDFQKGFGAGIMGLLVGLLELISEFARILAFAFRLFGNIFAGEVLLLVLASLVPLIITIPFFMFEIFVGFIQAFVFAILTMAFIAIAVTPHGGDDHH